MQNNLVMTSSPHLRDHSSTQRIMQEVCLALLPAGIAGVIIFGWSALMLICVSVATCVLSEFVWEKLTKRTVTIGDWSAVVTGLLLAYNLPANAPWWLAVVGGVIAIVLVKQMFGGIGMGLAVTAVLIFSNLFISLLRNIIPDSVRIPAYIIIIASFVTMIDMLLKAFLPDLSQALGMFIPLIVVNCIIFARAESFASKNPPVLSIADGLGMGLGFTFAITLLSVIRELLGNGTFFGLQVMPASYQPMGIMTQVPGGFITLGLLLILVNALSNKSKKKGAAA